MGLYLGSSKRKLLLGNIFCNLNLYMDDPITIKLMSSDGYILQDENGIGLVAGDMYLQNPFLTSLDYYTLIDLNGLFLTVKEDE